jgi:hypothetical protein
MVRRSKRKSAPRRQNNLSLTGVAQTYIVGSALSRATFGMDLGPFLLEGWATPSTKAKTTGTMVGMGSGWAQALSLAELVEVAVPGGSHAYNTPAHVTKMIKANMKQFGPAAIGTAIVTPIAFKMGRRLLSRSGVTRYANKAFKMTGLPVRV